MPASQFSWAMALLPRVVVYFRKEVVWCQPLGEEKRIEGLMRV